MLLCLNYDIDTTTDTGVFKFRTDFNQISHVYVLDTDDFRIEKHTMIDMVRARNKGIRVKGLNFTCNKNECVDTVRPMQQLVKLIKDSQYIMGGDDFIASFNMGSDDGISSAYIWYKGYYYKVEIKESNYNFFIYVNGKVAVCCSDVCYNGLQLMGIFEDDNFLIELASQYSCIHTINLQFTPDGCISNGGKVGIPMEKQSFKRRVVSEGFQ